MLWGRTGRGEQSRTMRREGGWESSGLCHRETEETTKPSQQRLFMLKRLDFVLWHREAREGFGTEG